MSKLVKLNSTNVSLAGEFLVLSQLALGGYIANMTLGHTKGIDILVANPKNGRMLKLEVKTNHRGISGHTKEFGKIVGAWMMSEKHETNRDPNLFYCFVSIGSDRKSHKCYVVPSTVVADYVCCEHKYWRSLKESRKANDVRTFRIGQASEEYPIPTPTVEDYEDNWEPLD